MAGMQEKVATVYQDMTQQVMTAVRNRLQVQFVLTTMGNP